MEAIYASFPNDFSRFEWTKNELEQNIDWQMLYLGR